MLVLSREISQAVLIDVPPSEHRTQIRVLLSDVRGDRVRLGFDADKSVTVMREEIVGADGHVRLANH
jgi:carbon storage regulator CsrA